MKVAIRTDSTLEIGSGHVMRCLTLARRLSCAGSSVRFLCREDAGNLCDHIEASGFAIFRLPPGAVAKKATWQEDAEQSLFALKSASFFPDLLVVDHYGLDEKWERALRPVVKRILVIDDLANRIHDCDVLLDPNLHDSPESRYAGLVGAAVRVFVGPQYALLRPEFEQVAPRLRDQGVGQMLAFFGGSDPSNEAGKIVRAHHLLAARAPRTVLVLGAINPRAREISEMAQRRSGLEVIERTSQMARLMAQSDLAAGTCGGSAWERCTLGLPAIVVVSADNQKDDARILDVLGAARNLGAAAVTTAETWAEAIAALRDNPEALQRMSEAAQRVMSGRKEAMREFEGALVH